MFSACCCSWLWVLNLDSLVTPSTSWATSAPEALLDVGQAVLGVLGDVVEERGLDGDRVDAELGEDLGRGDRVGDVRLAGRPALARVGLDGEVEGPVDRLEVGLRVVLGDRRLEGRAQGLEVDRAVLGAARDGRRAAGTAALDGARVALGGRRLGARGLGGGGRAVARARSPRRRSRSPRRSRRCPSGFRVRWRGRHRAARIAARLSRTRAARRARLGLGPFVPRLARRPGR